MNKQQMPAWYDIKTFPMPLMGGGEDMAGLLASRAAIQQLVDSDSDRGRTVLMGFSQGGAMTYLTGLTTAERAENGGEKGKGGRYAGLALFGSRIYAVDFIRQVRTAPCTLTGFFSPWLAIVTTSFLLAFLLAWSVPVY